MPKLKPGTIVPTPEEDAAINAGIAADPDSSEWTEEGFAHARPAQEFFGTEAYAGLVALKRKSSQTGPGNYPDSPQNGMCGEKDDRQHDR